MPKIVWDDVGEKIYETGIDRGVLYLSTGLGVPWNGLISVSENANGSTPIPVYYDGVKILDQQVLSDFSGTIKAYTYPDEFSEVEGIVDSGGGLLLTNQPKQQFGLSYRTLIGNDVSGTNFGYKLHVVYNLHGVQESTEYQTMADVLEAIEFSWSVTSVPVAVNGYRPTAHFIFDSTKADPATLLNLENILYGSGGTFPRLPSAEELFGYINNVSAIVIIDNGFGLWTAIGPDQYFTMLDATTFQITNANATYLNADTYQVSST